MSSASPRNIRNRKRPSSNNQFQSIKNNVLKTIRNPSELFNLGKDLLFNSDYLYLIILILLPLELIINVLIINKIQCKSLKLNLKSELYYITISLRYRNRLGGIYARS